MKVKSWSFNKDDEVKHSIVRRCVWCREWSRREPRAERGTGNISIWKVPSGRFHLEGSAAARRGAVKGALGNYNTENRCGEIYPLISTAAEQTMRRRRMEVLKLIGNKNRGQNPREEERWNVSGDNRGLPKPSGWNVGEETTVGGLIFTSQNV